jgi:hypothetical protein
LLIESIKQVKRRVKWFSVGATAVFGSVVVTSLVGDYIFPSRVNGAVWSFGTSAYPWLLLGATVALARLNQEQTEPGIIMLEPEDHTQLP